MLPTSLDEIVRDSRTRVRRLRRIYGNPADFDHYVKTIIQDSLIGYDPKAVAFVMKAIFRER